MSVFTIVALIILPILGGFIAWAGDIIGYRLGRSRRSVLGLRPRSTARLIAVIVGVLLPALTMGLAAVGSENVRIALFRLTQLTERRAQLEAENTRLTASLESSRQQKESAQQQYDEARRRLATAHAELAAAEGSLRRAQADLKAARTERERLQGQVRELQANRDELKNDLAKAQSSLATSIAALAKTEADLRRAEGELAAVELRAQELANEVRTWTVRAEQAQAEVEKAQRELASTSAELEAKREALEDTKTAAAAIAAVWGQHEDIAGANPVLYEPGAELVRGTISSRESLAQIEASLQELMVLAARNAAALGVEPPEGQAAVQLMMPLPPGGVPGLPTQAAIIRLVAQTVREAEAPEYVAVVRAVFRSFAGDGRPVAAGLFVRPNHLVYPRGTVIVRKVIDGNRPRAEVFQRLWGLLADLRTTAMGAGLMRDPATGQYGQVPAESILLALDQLLEHRQPLQVEAVVTEDVYVATEQPFLVWLRVEEPKGEPGA